MKKYPLIEFHIIQSFPVSCLNRDDLNSPKTCFIGGVERARVSSQCWKRVVRQELHERGVKLAIRTKNVEKTLVQKLIDLNASETQAKECAKTVAKEITKDTLIFLSDQEYSAIAEYIKELDFDENKIKKDAVVKLLSKAKVGPLDGLDIALFGRMVAQAPVINVEAAAAFSHAFSTHACTSELDFFTALDDIKLADPNDFTAGHLGNMEFSAATYYRYVSLNLNQLASVLNIEKASELIEPVKTFITALYLAVPSARQSTMSASNSWDFARVYIRTGQRIQCGFEQPVKSGACGGFLKPSIEVLKETLEMKECQAGDLFGKLAQFDFGEDRSSISELIEKISEVIMNIKE
ncbi:type I-E CRISPR-associated protein Cas7/Cse4/CasC [Sutterella sp.]|uniref:type I-E CRISPR-associated protein Cas7/Cse4/CasC n=1 Tax=Sutterella sp. TaxID=1981025 RepID=UPI0026E0AE7B|nr:type I-E CRISPR-associated protein Cas7/Cse4/CasC [Sutterella sp.]MDO5530952.1 type I-E CRISPR-associated protein Cas7/Cse4/CasC [Sutterella sp.]